jgi:DNA-binding MarR family transcriptional regulator
MVTRWLNDNEMRGWRALVENYGPLLAALEADLSAHGLTFGDYEVLVVLSENPDHQVRMCDLSERLGLSPSGLTRRLDGLVRAGHVQRIPNQNDRRVTNAVITDSGFDALRRAVPEHVASVRRHLVDLLTPEQLTVLGDIFLTVGLALGRESSYAA